MSMTRELKKRLMGIDDRIGKLEKRKPTPRINGEDLSESPGDTDSRLENIEAVLQIPGEKVGDTQILSAWREIIESKLDQIEKVLVMPGPSGFLSGFANKVDQVMTDLKGRLKELEDKALPRPPVWVKEIETKVRDLQTRDRHLTKEMNDNRPILKGMVEQLNTMETKPVAGALSQVTGKMVEDIEGNTRGLKKLQDTVDRFKKQCAIILIVLSTITIFLLFAVTIL